MIELGFAFTIIEIILIIDILLMVITMYYTGEMLSREMLIIGGGLLVTTIVFVLLYQNPSSYVNSALPLLNQSFYLFSSVVIGLIIPFIAIILLYRRVSKALKIITFMSRGEERVNILSGKINQLNTNVSRVEEEINNLSSQIDEKNRELKIISKIRW